MATAGMGGGTAAMGYGSLIAQGVANTISAFGSIGLTRINNRIAARQANIARINAQMMMSQYEATLRANERAVVQKTMAAGRAKSTQRAALAANGVAVGEGSAAELTASTDIVKEMDVNTMNSNALREAWGYRMKAVDYENQAIMAKAQKQSVGTNFAVSLLGGAAQTGMSYMSMAQAGMFSMGSSGSSTSTPTVSNASYMHNWLSSPSAGQFSNWGSMQLYKLRGY